MAGSFSLVLAVLGAILPVMPTTPFLLASAYCYARSFRRGHDWLTTNRLFGRHVAGMAAGRKLSPPIKAALIASSWATAAVSAIFLAPNLPARLAGLGMAAAMTAYIALQGRRSPRPVRTEAPSRRSR